MQRITTAYQDLRHPRRSFARTIARTGPYRDLVGELGSLAELVDDTDIDCDVCFSYLLEAAVPVLVRISMVGPYAVLARAGQDGRIELITGDRDCRSDLERSALHVLLRHQVMVLSADQLEHPVALDLPEIDRPTVHHALFSPEDGIRPW
ncbi:hypothetical protein OHV05_07045 [Kitasatospora sp. NBC_00070]|uniref:hypothetical protein n=1 Tax=Kitasatospora sp. NBC_00070 TaxID=2975962 RepID=UPI003247EACE